MKLALETGQELRLGKLIGNGGEGDVFLVDNLKQRVIKIYHNPLPKRQEAKLRAMITLSSSDLVHNSAWPEAIATQGVSGRAIGVILPLVEGHELHAVYGPNHRKQCLPNATWEFLVYTARNLAIAFEVMHKHGMVIGDINEKNCVVSKDARVRLLDCDSYQIPANGGGYYLCNVGVPHYTPPELQGKDLSRVDRNTNHDAFGLAVLIFQLLFMARHPYAGVAHNQRLATLDNGESIKNFLYAYGKNSQSLGISPPPHTLPVNILPQLLGDLFENAFSQASATSSTRPSARHWILALEHLLKSILTCRQDKSHKYSAHLSACPWCSFFQTNGITFFLPAFVVAGFDLSIANVQNFRNAFAQLRKLPLTKKTEADYQVQAMPGKQVSNILRLPAPSFYLGLAIIGVTLAIVASTGWWILLFLLIWGFSLAKEGQHSKEFTKEKIVRKAKYDEYKKTSNGLLANLRNTIESYETTFDSTSQKTSKNIERYASLGAERANLIRELESKRRTIQLEIFLQQFMISKGTIRGIGPNRKASLLAYGIETAADINWSDIQRIPGFGSQLCVMLEMWRTSCEKRFVYDGSKQIPRQFYDDIDRKVSALKLSLEEDIRKSIKTLAELNSRTMAQYKDIDARLPVFLMQSVQAKADYDILG